MEMGEMSISKAQFFDMQQRLCKSMKARVIPEIMLQNLHITISGQIRGGKNNIGITRTGRRYPNPDWAKWRHEKIAEVHSQLPKHWVPIDFKVNVRIDYFAEDNRRRDQPAIYDSIFHVLEKAGVVKDDTLIWVTSSQRIINPLEPKAVIWSWKQQV
ncbi:MAG: hypothetical protein KGL39_41005 [Patescibacteria group bacterium]|nr:hypothetical protein [Patescibacteria group bacterium]